MATHFVVTISRAYCNNQPRIWGKLLQSRARGRFAITPKVTWHKLKCVVPVIKETLCYTITSKQNLELAYFCQKVTLSENCNNQPRSPLQPTYAMHTHRPSSLIMQPIIQVLGVQGRPTLICTAITSGILCDNYSL